MANKSYEKRRNTPRLPIVYTTAEILQKLDYLAGIHSSKKAAIEVAICELFNKEKAKWNLHLLIVFGYVSRF